MSSFLVVDLSLFISYADNTEGDEKGEEVEDVEGA
jgi:hypothetical protein